MRTKITLLTLTFLLFFSSLTSVQIEVEYFRCDSCNNVPANKPVTIVYPFAIEDTSGMSLDVINLAKYIVFETDGVFLLQKSIVMFVNACHFFSEL